jgi:hypothetical protein
MLDYLLGVDGDYDALAAEAHGRSFDEFRIVDCRCVDRDLVAAGEQKVPDIVEVPYAAADSKRHEDLFCGAADNVEDDAALLMRCRDVQERELVSSLLVINLRDLDRVAGIAQVYEAYAFYNAACLYIKAGDDTLC